MKRWLILAAACACAIATPARAASPATPDTLVACEAAFAHDAAATSVRDAFLAWLAPTSVVFAPDPTNAARHYAARKADATQLAWWPEIAVMSGAGDLGWTSGPYQWRRGPGREPPDDTGSFVTLWRRQANGAWRVVLDAGVSQPAPADGRRPAELRALPAATRSQPTLSKRHVLWKADADYATLANTQGLAAALAASAAPGVRWLREGIAPVTARDAARDSAAARHPKGLMRSLGQFIADSGDLGYTFGTFVEGGPAAPDSSYYVHIWERTPGHPWQLALELFSPVPKRGR